MVDLVANIAARRAPHATWLRPGMHDIPAPDGASGVVTSFNGLQFGRLVSEDVTGLVKYLREHAAASS